MSYVSIYLSVFLKVFYMACMCHICFVRMEEFEDFLDVLRVVAVARTGGMQECQGGRNDTTQYYRHIVDTPHIRLATNLKKSFTLKSILIVSIMSNFNCITMILLQWI